MNKKSNWNELKLRQLIQSSFDLNELRALCFDLGIDYDELGENLPKSVRIIRLIQHSIERERFIDLIKALKNARPLFTWPEIDDLNLHSFWINDEVHSPLNIPSLPPHFVPRNTLLGKIKEHLLTDSEASVLQPKPIGLHGMGGVGKSVLAATLAYDDDILVSFSDGVYWLELNQKPNILVKQEQLARALGGNFTGCQDAGQGKEKLSQIISNKNCLIIIDDVWNLSDIQNFQIVKAGENSRILFTTRDREIVTALGAKLIDLVGLDKQQSLSLLASWVDLPEATLPDDTQTVASLCGYLPLALALCGAQVRDGLLWQDVIKALRNADIQFLDHQYGSVMASMKNSFDALSEVEQLLYQTLAALPSKIAIPEQTLITLWRHLTNLQDYQVRQQVSKFARKSLLQINGNPKEQQIILHDLQHLFIRQHTGLAKIEDLNQYWVSAYEAQMTDGWGSISDDGYFYRNIHLHLIEGSQYQKLSDALCDSNFLLNVSKTFTKTGYLRKNHLTEYLTTCFSAVSSTVHLVQKLVNMNDHLKYFVMCLDLHEVGNWDKKACCKQCGKHTIIHGYVDTGATWDFHDNYFSWCTSCYWSWYLYDSQMYGYEEMPMKFNYDTNTYS